MPSSASRSCPATRSSITCARSGAAATSGGSRRRRRSPAQGRRGGSQRHAGGRLSWRSVHPTAIVETGAELAEGVSVGPYSVVGGAVRLGDGASSIRMSWSAGDTTDRRRLRDLPVRQRRPAAAGHEISRRGEPARDRQQLHDPRARDDQPRHRRRRAADRASATIACSSSARMSRTIAASATTSSWSTTRRSAAIAGSATTLSSAGFPPCTSSCGSARAASSAACRGWKTTSSPSARRSATVPSSAASTSSG